MGRLELILPNKEYKGEFAKNNEIIHGSPGLNNTRSIDEWLKILLYNSKEETVQEGFVPATTYMAMNIEYNKIIGMINIRNYLNDYLLNFGGHIGYSIRKSERKKGYGKEMLNLALKKCYEMNLKKVLITCDKSNIASAKTIISNNGILENEIMEEGKLVQRYWILLNYLFR